MAATIIITCTQCKKQMKAPAELEGKKVRCKGCGATFVIKASTAQGEPAKAAPSKTAPAKAATSKTAQATKPAAAPQSKPYSEPDDDGPTTYSLQGEDYVAPAPTPKKEDKAAPKAKLPGDDDSKPYDVTITDLTPRCPHCAKELDSEDAVVCLHCGYNTRTRQSTRTRRVEDQTFKDYLLWLGPGILCVIGIFVLLGADYYFVWGLADTWKEMDDMTSTTSFSRGLQFWFCATSVWGMWKALRFAIQRLIMNPKPPEIEIK